MATSMPTSGRPYSVEEMLSLRRALPEVNCLVNKLNKHPEIGVLRTPEEPLVEVTNRRKLLRSSNRHTEDTSEESEAHVSFSSKLSNGTRQGWHLRSRDSSTRSSEPHSAPSGIASQQSENFQRFYRAVVSPTHVRVTAGGRIVPNTRAVAPPKFDWNPDKCLFEPGKPFSNTEVNISQAHDLWPLNAPLQPVVGSLLPPSQLTNYNFLPQIAPLPNAQAISIPRKNMAAQNFDSLEGHAQALENIQPSKPATSDPSYNPNLPQPIKISPPSQFDHSRPFVINGQVVYPVPAGFQPPPNSIPMPITVLGDPALQHQVPNGNFLPPPFPMPMPMPMPLMIPPGSVGHHMMFPNGGSLFEGGLPMAPYMPQFTPGLVSLSELTKSQIHGFRNQVKHIDNQLVNNKHQVDVTFLECQRSELIDFIGKMETMLHIQLGQETHQVSMAHLNGKTGEKARIPSRTGSTEALRYGSIGGTDNKKSSFIRSSTASTEELKNDSVVAPPIPLFIPNSQQSASRTEHEDTHVIKTSAESKPSTRSEPATKSRLTVAAAKAPPFQPRAHTLAQRSESDSAGIVAKKTSRDSIILPNPAAIAPQSGTHGRRTANSSSDWGQLTPYSGMSHPSLSRAQSLQASEILDAHQSSHLQRAHTFHAPISAYETASKPYLIGTFPNGMRLGEGSDIMYSRPLTEDEVRARHLYWGDAPRSVLKGSGLPKFDGKDFYPPSPVKAMAKPALSNGYLPTTTASLAFETLFTDPQLAGYQTPPQARAKSSEQDLVPTPTRGFAQNDIIGFQSPSPRPATYTFENKLPQNWSSTHCGSGEESTKTQPAATATLVQDDFSTLFTSPSAHQHHHTPKSAGTLEPTTPHNKAVGDLDDSKDDEPESLDSWGAPKNTAETIYEDVVDLTSIKSNTDDSQRSTAMVEFRLPSSSRVHSPKRASGNPVMERQANVTGGTDSSTLFLQNMLRNTAAATTMAAPAVSGAISSATAQGYLPSHRGSAAASLAPAMFNTVTTMEREDESGNLKIDHIMINADGEFEVSTDGVAPLIAANFSLENRPLDRDRPRRPIRASVETLGAEGYLRYLTQKAEDDKQIVEGGWNSNTTGTGPVKPGSDW